MSDSMRGIFYRSDTRLPATIFPNGFGKRDASYLNPKLRFVMGPDAAPDIEPTSAVCFTRHFEAAPLFPVGDLTTNSWVYVLDLDVKEIVNTQQSQYNHVVSVVQTGNANALWPMFGQERCVNSIAGKDIVGAVLVQRRFNGGDVFSGGDFKPGNYVANPGYTGPASTAQLVSTSIGKLISDNAWIPMPTQAQGITLSTRK